MCIDEGKEFFHTPPSTPPTPRRKTSTPTPKPEVVHIVAPEPRVPDVIPKKEEYPVRVLIGEPEPAPREVRKAESPVRILVAEPEPKPRETRKPESPIRVLVDEPKPMARNNSIARRSQTQEFPRVVQYTGEPMSPVLPCLKIDARNDRNETEKIISPVIGKVRMAFGKDVPEEGEEKQPYLKGVGKLPVVPQQKRAVSSSPVAVRKRMKSPIPRPSSATPPGTPLERPGNQATRST